MDGRAREVDTEHKYTDEQNKSQKEWGDKVKRLKRLSAKQDDPGSHEGAPKAHTWPGKKAHCLVVASE